MNGPVPETQYPGYQIPKESLLQYLETLKYPFSEALSTVAKSAIEGGHGESESEFPNWQDIYNKINDEQMVIHLDTGRVTAEGGARAFTTPGLTTATPDTILMNEPTVGGTGSEKYWEMMDAILPESQRKYNMGIGVGLGEVLPHELIHTNIPGKKQFVHGAQQSRPHERETFGKWIRAGTEFAPVHTNVFRQGIEESMFPVMEEGGISGESTPGWSILQDIFEGYKDWKLPKE